MKKKLKLYGFSKSPTRNYFCIEKKDEFIPAFDKFLKGLGFRELDIHGFFRPHGGAELKSLAYETDTQHFFQNEEYDVNLVIGYERIFLFIYSGKGDKQRKIMQGILKFCDVMDVSCPLSRASKGLDRVKT